MAVLALQPVLLGVPTVDGARYAGDGHIVAVVCRGIFQLMVADRAVIVVRYGGVAPVASKQAISAIRATTSNVNHK